MALNSDRDGFLLPDERLSGDDLSRGIRNIERNTDAILALIQARTRAQERASVTNPNARQRASGGAPDATPGPAPAPGRRAAAERTSIPVPGGGGGAGSGGVRGRDSRGRFTRDPAAEVAGEVRQLTRQQAQQNAERERAEEAQRTREGGNRNQTRGADGRFGSGGGSEDEKKGLFGRMKDFFKDRSGDVSMGDAEQIDPVLESAKEVMGMVGGAVGALKATGELGRAVIGRGFGGRKSDDGQAGWFKRLLQQLKLMRRDDTQFHQAELRALNEPQGGQGGGSIIAELSKLIFSPLGAAIVAALAGVWMGFGDKITGAWSSFIGGMKAKWDEAVEKFMGIWEPIAKFFADKFGIVTNAVGAAADKANEVVKDATGVDVKQKAAQVADATSRAADVTASKAGSLLEKIKPGYRHKALFDGIKGGADLTKHGRYTDAEAEKIRQLKTSGANTSANMPGGMSKQTRHKIIERSKAAGVDPETMLKFAAMESGGNPNAISSTGAIGTFQIVGGTASGLGVRDRFNEDQNIAGGVELARRSTAALQKAKLPVTPENLYMMHMLGPEAAKEVIRGAASGKQASELSPETRALMAKNHGSSAKTAAEFLGANKAALEQRYVSVVPKDGAPQLAAKPGEKHAATTPQAAPGAAPAAGLVGRPGGVAPAAPGGASAPGPAATAGAAAHPGGTVAPSVGAQPLVLGAAKVPTVAGVPSQAGAVPSASVPTVTPTMAGAMPAPGVVAGPPRIVSVAVPTQAAPAPAPRGDAPIPLGSKAPVEVTVRNSEKPAGQDLRDRRLAHIATGGMAGQG